MDYPNPQEYYTKAEVDVMIAAAVAEAQRDLHKSVLEAGTCQQLVHAFGDLLQEDYRKIRDNGCYYIGPDGERHSLYEVQHYPNNDKKGGGESGVTSG